MNQTQKPNVLFILTDDQRFDTIHALGNQVIKTPFMDELVENGTSFTNAYIMGGSSPAVCAPSRAMIMTGRTLYRIPKQGLWEYRIDEDLKTIPEVFREAGYDTFGTGKQHNSQGVFARGFSHAGNVFFGGMSNHLKVPVQDYDPSCEYPDDNKRIGGKFSTELFTDAALEFLNNRQVRDEQKENKPFFMYVAYTAPHDPLMPPEEFVEMYADQEIDLPENYMPDHPFDNGTLHVRPFQIGNPVESIGWPLKPEDVIRAIRAYYGMITHMDKEMGRIINKLKEMGEFDNTIIVLAGDNGQALGQHGDMHKQSVYDHAIHVPLVFSGPSISKNIKSDSYVYLFDIFPTLTELAGLATPQTVEGKSLVPILNNPNEAMRDYLYFAHLQYQRALQDKQFKLIEYVVNGDRHTQLFDLKNDPKEMNNLYSNPEYSTHLQRLRNELTKWKTEFGDHTEQGKEFWSNYNLPHGL